MRLSGVLVAVMLTAGVHGAEFQFYAEEAELQTGHTQVVLQLYDNKGASSYLTCGKVSGGFNIHIRKGDWTAFGLESMPVGVSAMVGTKTLTPNYTDVVASELKDSSGVAVAVSGIRNFASAVEQYGAGSPLRLQLSEAVGGWDSFAVMPTLKDAVNSEFRSFLRKCKTLANWG